MVKIRSIFLYGLAVCMVLAVLSGCGKTQNTAKSSLREREALDSDRVFSITHSAYDGSFRNELTADELVFYNAFEQHFLEERSLNPFDVDISGMGYIGAETDYSRLGYLFQISLYAFCNDHPEAYWVGKANINYDCEDNSSHIVRAVITPSEQYAGAYSDWTAVQNGIREAVDEIRRSRASDSRYDTVLAIHDYVCNNLSYHYADEYYGEQQCAAPLFGGGSIGKKAVCEGLIQVNPAIGCKLPPKKAREMQVLTHDEMQRFLIQAKHDGYYEIFMLDLATGLRRGELMGLNPAAVSQRYHRLLEKCRKLDGNS